jgi:hypothetical protein
MGALRSHYSDFACWRPPMFAVPATLC